MDRFDIKQETKILNALKKILTEKENLFSEEEILKDACALDSDHICMIEGLTSEGKLCLRRFIDNDSDQEALKQIFNSDFSDIGEVGTGVGVTSKYFKRAVDLLDISGETFKIYAKKDYPLVLENKHFKIIIAPRIEND